MNARVMSLVLILALFAGNRIVESGEDGFTLLFNGKDLSGWKTTDDILAHWKVEEGVIDYDSQCKGQTKDLWTEKSFDDFVLKLEWMQPEPEESHRKPMFPIRRDGRLTPPRGPRRMVQIVYAGDSGVYLRGSKKARVNIWSHPSGSGGIKAYRLDEEVPQKIRGGATAQTSEDNKVGEWNTFEITVKGNRVSVKLNDKLVVDYAELPGLPERGPIALVHDGDPKHPRHIQFRNIEIKELK